MLADVGCPSGTMPMTIGVPVLIRVWAQIGSSLEKFGRPSGRLL